MRIDEWRRWLVGAAWIAVAAWGPRVAAEPSAVEQAADEAVSLYYTYQGAEPSEEQRTAGRSAALVLLAEGYSAADIDAAVVKVFQEIAGAATAPFELIVPSFVRATYTPGGAAAIADPPPPPPPEPTPPPPEPTPAQVEDEDDDEDDDDRGGSTGARVAGRVLMGIGVPCFAVGYGLTLVAGAVAPTVNGVNPGPSIAGSLIPFAGPTVAWLAGGEAGDFDTEWSRFAPLVGTLTFLQAFGFTFMMISAGVSGSADALSPDQPPDSRVAIRDVCVLPYATPDGAGGQLTFRW